MKFRSPAAYLIAALLITAGISAFVPGCGENTGPSSPDGTETPVDPGPTADSLKVLFIGNSYTHYNDLPGMFAGLAAAAGKKVIVDRMVIGGTDLSEFCVMEECTEKINSDSWHYVSLQGFGPNLVYPQLFPFGEKSGIDCLAMRIRNNCPASIPFYFMGWGFEDGMAWYDGYTDTYEQLQQKIIDATIELADTTGLMIAPVGACWKQAIAARPDLGLFDPDMSHPALPGSYLAACVIYCCLFQEPVSGNPYLGSLDQADAAFLQQTASVELMFNGHLYNITPPDTNIAGICGEASP